MSPQTARSVWDEADDLLGRQTTPSSVWDEADALLKTPTLTPLSTLTIGGQPYTTGRFTPKEAEVIGQSPAAQASVSPMMPGPPRPPAPTVPLPRGAGVVVDPTAAFEEGAPPVGAGRILSGVARTGRALFTPPSARAGYEPELEPTPEDVRAQVLSGVPPTVLPQEAKAGISDVVEGAFTTMTPLIAGGLLSAPVRTLIGVGSAMAADRAAKRAVLALGGDEESARLAGNLASAAVVSGVGDQVLRIARTKVAEAAEATGKKVTAAARPVVMSSLLSGSPVPETAKTIPFGEPGIPENPAYTQTTGGPRRPIPTPGEPAVAPLPAPVETPRVVPPARGVSIGRPAAPPAVPREAPAAPLGATPTPPTVTARGPVAPPEAVAPAPAPVDISRLIPAAGPAAVWDEADALLGQQPKPEPHKFSSTQVMLPTAASTPVLEMAAAIPEEDLAKDGRAGQTPDTMPHVTVKYGLHTVDAEQVRKVLADEPPITLTLGTTSFFPNSESDHGDVLNVDVDSPDLHRLNKKIAGALEVTDTHPDYQPHVTIAYLKPGLGQKYEGDDSLKGQTVTLDRVTFSAKDGTTTEIALTGQPKARQQATPHVPQATATYNADRHSMEIKFPAKPDLATRDRLKTAGYRWGKTNQVWYKRIEKPRDRPWANVIAGRTAEALALIGQPSPSLPVAQQEVVPAADTSMTALRTAFAEKFTKGQEVEVKDADGVWKKATVRADTVEGQTAVGHPSLRMQPMWPPGAPSTIPTTHFGPGEIRALTPAPEAPTVQPEAPHEPRPTRVPPGAGQLPERGAGGAEPVRAAGEAPLGAVPPEPEPAVPRAGAAGTRHGGARGGVAPRVSRDVDTGAEPEPASPPGGRPLQSGLVAPAGDTHDPGVPASDYVFTPERVAAIIGRGALTRAEGNLTAIRLVKTLTTEQRHATSAEQDQLAQYVGWGSSALAAFLRDAPSYTWSAHEKAIWQELQTILTPDERQALIRSTPNAHFTYDLYRPIWAALEQAGFAGGRVLEPAVGVGHAFGFMSPEVRVASTLNGVELEPITAAIAAQLYPSARIQPVGYEQSRIARGTQDLIISNVPFGDFGVTDPQFAGAPRFLTDRIHNYFFVKALDHVRPGGLIVFVTSRYTMDSTNATPVRRYLMERAEFVGAVRLPNTAFDKSAKTEVVTDVVVLRRLREGETAQNAAAFIEAPKHEGLSTVTTTGWGRHAKSRPQNVYRSAWYTAHPDLILGTETLEGTMRAGGEYTVTARGADVQGALQTALESILPPGTYARETRPTAIRPTKVAEGAYKPGELRVAGKRIDSVLQDGSIEDATPTKPNGSVDHGAVQRLIGMIGIRDDLRVVVATMLDPTVTPVAISAAQKKLSRTYQTFRTRHGELNGSVNKRLFKNDPEATNLLGLERLTAKSTLARRKDGTDVLRMSYHVTGLADIFTKRTLHPDTDIVHVDTPQDALFTSLGVHAAIEWPYMASLTGATVESLQQALTAEGLVFEQPDGAFVLAEEYLSGDVVSKLADVQAADDPARFAANVKALEAVQPTPKTKTDIELGNVSIGLGAHWVPPEDLRTFVVEQLGIGRPHAVTYRLEGAQAMVRWAYTANDTAKMAAVRHALSVPYQGGVYDLLDLIDDTLNLETPVLGHYEGSGKDRHFVKEPEATLAARANQDTLRDAWTQWLYQHPDVQDRLLETFNTRFNRTVERTFDGSYLKYPGMATLVDEHGTVLTFFPHQNRGVARILLTGNTLLAHEVGAGKTFEMIAAAMKMRQTGRAQKPMIVVPTYLLPQWRADVSRLYPTAKVLAFDEKDLAADKRQTAMARIAFGDWDIVLVPHSSFGLLRVSDARILATMQAWITELQEAEAAGVPGSDSVKAMERQRRKIEDKVHKKADSLARSPDRGLTWEQLGVDALFIDEAQAFKNLFFFSKMNTLRGLSRSESDRALDLYVKVQDLNEQSHHRNLVLATATPVMNSIAEIFTMQRYLQPHVLRQYGLENFDNWYAMFARALPTIEQQPDGTYKEVQRLREYQNLLTLSSMVRTVMDYVGWEDMPYLKLPKIAGGRIRIVQTEPHAMYPVIREWFAARMQNLRNMPPHIDRQGNYIAPDRLDPITGNSLGVPDNILTVMTDAKKAAIDVRLVLGDRATDWPGSRLQTAANELAAEYKRQQAKKGVVLVFLDMGTPKQPGPLSFLHHVAAEEAEDVIEADTDVEGVTDALESQVAGDTDSFNLYDALREALVKRGVPAREIAYIHQAKNSAERLALFQAANEGHVRFVFASTDKGGIGMNIQTRLAAIHEIDAPRAQRPGDLRQRMGRGIRQGNTYPEVALVRYVTKGTTDEWLWGLLNTKDYQIRQFLKGQAATLTEDDPSTMSLEEAQIRSSGDPRGIELTELKGRFARLEAQAAAAERQVHGARADVALGEKSIAYWEGRLDALQAWLPHHASLRGDAFTLTVGTQTYTNRDQANAALIEALKPIVAKEDPTASVPIGRVGGVPLTATYNGKEIVVEDKGSVMGLAVRKVLSVALALDGSVYGDTSHIAATVARSVASDPATLGAGQNIVASLVNAYEAIPALVTQAKTQIADTETSAAQSRRLLAHPPDVIATMRTARTRIVALEQELKAEGEAQAHDRNLAQQVAKGRVALLERLTRQVHAATTDVERAAVWHEADEAGLHADLEDATQQVWPVTGGSVGTAPTPVSAPTAGRPQREAGTPPPGAPIPLDRLMEFPSLQKMPAELRADIAHLLHTHSGFAPQRRGVQSWAATQAEAAQYRLPLERLRPGTALNAEELEAYKTAVATVLTARRAILDRIKAGDATTPEKLEFVQLSNLATALVASYRGAKAEAGRALNILKSQARVLDVGDLKFIEAAVQAPGFRGDLEAITKASLEADGDPLKQLRLLRERAAGTRFSKWQALYYANLLSGVKTQERNILGNAFNALANIVTPVGAAPFDLARSMLTGQARTVYLGEVKQNVVGSAVGFERGLRDGLFAFREGFRRSTVEAAAAGQFDAPLAEAPGGMITNWPLRMLLGADEFFRAIARSQELHAGSYAEARKAGYRGDAIRDFMADFMTSVTSPDADAVRDAADLFAARALFQEEPGAMTRWLLQAKAPYQPLPLRIAATFTVPFIKTPASILRQGLEWSPPGFIMREIRTQGGRRQSQAGGRALLGSLLLLPLAWLAATGRLTGAPPRGEGEREEFYAQGKQPNSVRIGPWWIRYVLFQPFSVPMAAVANAWQQFHQSDHSEHSAAEAFASAMAGVGASMLDMSFLSGLSTIVEAIQNPERVERWLALAAQGLVPGSGLLRNLTQALDPYIHKPQGLVESVETIIPGRSQTLPVRRGRFGEPLTRPGGPIRRGFLVPEFSRAVDDPVVEALTRLQVRPGIPRATFTLHGKPVPLMRTQTDAVIEAIGRERYARVRFQLQRPEVSKFPDEAQRRLLRGSIEQATDAVRARVLRHLADKTTFTWEDLVSPGARQNERDIGAAGVR